MQTMSSALEARLKIHQCHGTIAKLTKLSAETGKDELFCLKCSAFQPNVGIRDGKDVPYCLQAYATGSAGKPVENLLRRMWGKFSR